MTSTGLPRARARARAACGSATASTCSKCGSAWAASSFSGRARGFVERVATSLRPARASRARSSSIRLSPRIETQRTYSRAGRRASSQSTASGVCAPSQTSSPRRSRRPGRTTSTSCSTGRSRYASAVSLRASDHHARAGREELAVRVVRHDNYSCRMRNCKLLLRDLLDRVAEHLRVLEGDVRQQDDRRVDDVRRVEASAQPRLDDRHVHAGLGELGERGRGQRLELGRAELLRGLANPRDGPLERFGITIQPLVPARDVRRGVGACLQALGTEERGDRPGRGGLAVRPDHVDRREGTLRVSQRRQELPHAVEAELLGPRAERGDPFGRARRPSCGGHRAHDGSARACRAPPRRPRAVPSR